MKKRILASILSLCILISASPAFAAIKTLEVNQGLSYYMDKSSGKISLIETFVAEKNTVILVEVDEEIEIDPQTQRVEIIKDDGVVATLLPNGKGKTTLGTLVRYADDSVILCKRKNQADEAMKVILFIIRAYSKSKKVI